MIIYVLYFIFIAILAIQYEFIPFKSKYLLLVVIILLSLLAGFRTPDISKDYYGYKYFFDNIYNLIDDNVSTVLTVVEPGFIAIVIFFRNLFAANYGVAIMLFYALTSLLIKVFVINRYSINPYLTLLFYFSYFFLFYEMTQIRIGLASAIFLLSLSSFLNNKRVAFVGLILFATLFHYSAIFYLIILIFNLDTFNKKVYAGVLILSIVLGVLKLPILNLLGNFDPSLISDKFSNYVDAAENGVVVNVFNTVNICNMFCCLYFIFFIKDSVIINDKKLVFFLKCNLLSIFLLSFLSGAPAFALRFSQLFSIAQIFLFTYLVKYLPFKKWNIFFLILIAGIFFYITGFHSDLLKPYEIIKIK